MMDTHDRPDFESSTRPSSRPRTTAPVWSASGAMPMHERTSSPTGTSVLPHRKLNGASQPHVFEDRSAPLEITYEHAGEERTLDDYVERNHVAALLVLADGVVVHDRYRLGRAPGHPMASLVGVEELHQHRRRPSAAHRRARQHRRPGHQVHLDQRRLRRADRSAMC